MTAQIGDSYKWNKREYQIVAETAPLNFNPQEYGMDPFGFCSACWRGYWCEFDINDKGLFLQNLYINNHSGNYPTLNGVSVSPITYHEGISIGMHGEKDEKVLIEDHLGHRMYENVMLRIPYTGRIVVGRDFIDQYYIHMGFQRGWAYKELREFSFEAGYLIETIDHSEEAKQMREEMAKNNKNPKRPEGESITKFVNKSFSLDYKDKAWWIR